MGEDLTVPSEGDPPNIITLLESLLQSKKLGGTSHLQPAEPGLSDIPKQHSPTYIHLLLHSDAEVRDSCSQPEEE